MNRLVLLSFALLLVPIGSSFATQNNSGDNIYVIFVQTTVRNHDGTLLVYLESTKFIYLNMPALQSFLDFEASRGNDPIITIDGQKYQIIRRVQTEEYNSERLVANTALSDTVDGKTILLARFAHDGYTLHKGDTRESVWTFVRAVS